ncbi:MAG TPA: TldD/PmbA family protein [Candidatus Cloacimonetes bacterium]|nr:TldD/PmbA family protein [Candidatus Cloacimonadota bacterium]HHE40191.1 TldD/PmbA family protein [Candidatus Cloacimonadota bacterium]
MIRKSIIESVLQKALSNGADFSELFLEDSVSSTMQLLDRKIVKSISGNDYGAGVRVFYGHRAIYAFTNDVSEKGLLTVAEAVSKAETGDKRTEIIDLTQKTYDSPHKVLIPFNSVPIQDKIAFVHSIDNASRNFSDYISQVNINYMEKYQNIMIANSEGLSTQDQRTYARVYVSSIAFKDNQMQTGSEGPGALMGYEFFNNVDPEELGRKTAERAVKMLLAEYAPSGKFPVIIGNAFGGVIFHEACGHSLETTSVAKGASVFADKLNTRIANPCVTAIDDGTMLNKWGSTTIDDEGSPTQRTVLIDKGMLQSFMIDKLGGMKIGLPSTGSGRRQSYKFAPTSRMRNTYIDKGPDTIQDMISSVDFGLYAKKMGGGSVQPGTGDFNFAVGEGYLIEDGKISKPVRGATLIGNGKDILKRISMVSDDLELAEGMCGSQSGSIPTCVGQPTIKVDEIVVGGRKKIA